MAMIRHGSTEVTGFRYGSTEVDAVYYGATEVFVAFEDGSFVIEDDTLDVNGGSTVNLRVKLGARPRSDVTVALSETSSLISLGDDSLTFTPDNWDTYQTVVVTGVGNRDSLQLPNSAYSQDVASRRWALPIPRPQLDTSLGASRFLINVSIDFISQVYSVTVSFGPANNLDGTADLSSAFEMSGSVMVAFDGTDYIFALEGADTSEPYNWEPSNSSDVEALWNSLASATDRAATLTVRDYVPGDATISLSASGPDEYSSVTGSATVTVG